MRTFKTFFILEFKRFFGKRNGTIILLLLLLSLIFIQNGISEYNNILTQKEKFQELEKTRVSRYFNYRVYGTYGFRMLFVPAPITVFFNKSGVITDMTSFIDSGERLNIYTPLQGRNVFNLKKWGLSDFSGIIMFFASLMALFYGYETLNNDEYLKFLSTVTHARKVFISLLLSRIILIVLLFLIITSAGFLLLVINGLYVPLNKYMLSFLLLILLISIFFFVLGTAFSTVRSKITGLTTILSIWFILLFIIPTIINSYIANKADFITPLYRMEMEKFKILSDFEKRSIEKEGVFTPGKQPTDSIKNMMHDGLNNEFVRIMALEEDMRNQMKKNISLYQGLSMLFPSSFYVSANNEISSRGYDNLIEFYRHVHSLKREFTKFIFDKVYFSNFSKVESFLKDDKDKNVFDGQSQLPEYFVAGLLITICYIVFFILFSYRRYQKRLFSLHESGESTSSPLNNLDMKKGQFKVLVSEGDLYKIHLFNRFSFSEEGARKEFLYVCHPENIPGDIKAGDFFFFVKRLMQITGRENMDIRLPPAIKAITGKKFGALKNHEKGELILSILRLKGKTIYLVHDAARGMPIEFTVQLKERMHQLKEAGALVLYLTPDELINVQSIKKGHGLYESSTWCQLVDHYKGLLDIH
jgi:hypothetical protein